MSTREEANAVGVNPQAGRPRRRSECLDGPRPCPWVSCRYHLYLDVSAYGEVLIRSSEPPWEMVETCSLDIAAQGPHTQAEVGRLLGLSTQAIYLAERAVRERIAAQQSTPRVAYRSRHDVALAQRRRHMALLAGLLHVAWRDGAWPSAAALAEALALPGQSLASSLRSMERRGWVRLSQGAALTPAGLAVLQEAWAEDD